MSDDYEELISAVEADEAIGLGGYRGPAWSDRGGFDGVIVAVRHPVATFAWEEDGISAADDDVPLSSLWLDAGDDQVRNHLLGQIARQLPGHAERPGAYFLKILSATELVIMKLDQTGTGPASGSAEHRQRAFFLDNSFSLHPSRPADALKQLICFIASPGVALVGPVCGNAPPRDEDTKPREPGCVCHLEEGDSPCDVHPSEDDRPTEAQRKAMRETVAQLDAKWVPNGRLT